MAVKFFDPNSTILYFLGQRLTGFADGEFFTYERIMPGFQEVVGTDGEVARSKSNNFLVKGVVKLLQTSLSNAFLSGVHNTDLLAPNGAGVGTFSAQDLQGGTYLSSPKAWIVHFPEGSWDRTAKSREWELHMDMNGGIYTEGGNPG